MPSLERYPGLQSPLEQSKKIQEKTRPLRELRAQFEILDKLFGVETTLLPDGTLHVLQGQIVSRISPLGELEQVDLELKVSETGGDGENRRIPMIEPELVIGDRFASLKYPCNSIPVFQCALSKSSLHLMPENICTGTYVIRPF